MKQKTKTTITSNSNSTATTTISDQIFPDYTLGSDYVVTLPVDNIDYKDLTYTYTTDQTPADEVEKAELILAGICPACRRDDGKHDFSCPKYDYNVDGITINTKTQGSGVITVGNHSITEEKLEILDRIIDAVGDDLDVFLDTIKDTITSKKG